jgi:membrane-associated phospholipid phosphatase
VRLIRRRPAACEIASKRWAATIGVVAVLAVPRAATADPKTPAIADPKTPAIADPKADAETPCEETIKFGVDPVGDGALLLGAFGFASLGEAFLSTGELRPQQIEPTFDTKHLLPIDRAAVEQTVDPHADKFSSAGVYVAFGFAVADSVLSGFRYGHDAAIVDAVMYSEAVVISWGLTNLAKVAFRRPRPIAYIEREHAIEAGQDPATYNNTSTDSALSFYSGHTAFTATISASATYLAFARSPHTARPWLTLAGGVALTTFVGVERVRSGAHFPTDVIAGALAGAGIGMLVVHLHRQDAARRPVWVGAMPLDGGGGLTLGGLF